MNCNCIKNDSVRKYAFSEKYSSIYKDLGLCIDCNKSYILKDGAWKFISKSEFRRIVNMRMVKHE